MTLLQFNPNLLLIVKKKNLNIIKLVSQLNWDHLFLTILGKVSVPTVIYEDTVEDCLVEIILSLWCGLWVDIRKDSYPGQFLIFLLFQHLIWVVVKAINCILPGLFCDIVILKVIIGIANIYIYTGKFPNSIHGLL